MPLKLHQKKNLKTLLLNNISQHLPYDPSFWFGDVPIFGLDKMIRKCWDNMISDGMMGTMSRND
jgi:hypothetical protein